MTGTGISGKPITFTIGTQTSFATTNANGVATATLKLTQSPIPSYNVLTTITGDGYDVSSLDK